MTRSAKPVLQQPSVKQVFVSKDMTIGDVVQKYPEIAPILTQNGVHCVGCHVSSWETLEEGFMGHGMGEQDVDRVMLEINDFLNQQATAQPENENDVVVTESAVTKVKALMKAEGKAKHALRVAVTAGGCAGMSYELSFIEKGEKDDIVKKQNGLTIYLDKNSMEFMDGATIDFVDSLQESGFKIKNPKAKSGCGCGKSFG